MEGFVPFFLGQLKEKQFFNLDTEVAQSNAAWYAMQEMPASKMECARHNVGKIII